MTKKILVADDSPTIQKVISITLSEEPFEIDECLNTKDLFEYIGEEDYNLVLLDINLSEDKSGYDLTKEILKKSPDSKIMLLLGTFDTISDSQFAESGAHEKMVKPFDSKKFVQNCRSLIGDLDDEEYEEELDEEEYDEEEYDEEEYEEEDEEKLDADTQENDDEYEYEDDEYDELEEKQIKQNHENWVVQGSTKNIENSNEASVTISRLEENAQKLKLEKELDEWGGDLPSIISGEEDFSETKIPLPPLISQLSPSNSLENSESKNSDLFPDDDDLGYPGEKVQDELESIEGANSSQRFLSADELINDESENEEDATDPSYNIPENFNNELEKEVDRDISPDDFWAVDSGNEIGNGENLNASLDRSLEREEIEKEDLSTVNKKEEYTQKISIEELKPIIEEIVKKHCENTVAKVAWEVIPDLAENLIREELKEISQSIE